jgi:predicted DNA-binding ribbon-helix-helix protein
MDYEAPTNRPDVNRKRSIVVARKRTSVSLEDSFWASLQAIVRMEHTTIEHYIAKIEREGGGPNLSSNLRIAVLRYYQQIAARSLSNNGLQGVIARGPAFPERSNHLAEAAVAHGARLNGEAAG